MCTLVLNVAVISFSERRLYTDFPRKLVFVVGLCSISAITFTHAAIKVLGHDTDAAHITLVSLFFCVYQCSIGPFFWIYIPEILKIKDICYPMAFSWGTQLCIALTFLSKDLPYADVVYYFAFSLSSLGVAWLFHRYAIETKGVAWAVVAESLLADRYPESADSLDACEKISIQ